MFVFWLLLGVVTGVVITTFFFKNKPTVMADAMMLREELTLMENRLGRMVCVTENSLHDRFDEVVAEVKKKV